MDNTLKIKNKFGAWQILKKPFDLNIFLSHMKFGRKLLENAQGQKRSKGPFGLMQIFILVQKMEKLKAWHSWMNFTSSANLLHEKDHFCDQKNNPKGVPFNLFSFANIANFQKV